MQRQPTPQQLDAVYRVNGAVGPTLEDVVGASVPFVATTAFLRRGLIGGGSVDRTVVLEPALRVMYDNQLRGSRPNLPLPSFGPQLPDSFSPGLDQYLVTLTAGGRCASCHGAR